MHRTHTGQDEGGAVVVARVDRRGFFAVMATNAVAAIVRPAAAGAVEPSDGVVAPRYRETEHVRTFHRVNRYRTEARSCMAEATFVVQSLCGRPR